MNKFTRQEICEIHEAFWSKAGPTLFPDGGIGMHRRMLEPNGRQILDIIRCMKRLCPEEMESSLV